MRAQPPMRHMEHGSYPALSAWACVVVAGFIAAVVAFAWPAPTPAHAGDPRLEEAEQQRRQAQQRLDDVLQRMGTVQAEVSAAEQELAALQGTVDALQQDAEQATAAVAHLAQASYRYGTADPTLALLTSDSPGQALEQARLLGVLAKRSRAGYEAASAGRIRTQVAADEVARVSEILHARRDELERTRAEAAALLAAAEREEQQARATVAAERAATERARPSRRAASASRPARGGPPGAPAAVSGGIACPVGRPHSFSDTYGAPRSGGRSHKGTDILAPRGTSIHAYESGVITRMNSSRLGGISVYLRGNSGTRYYYTHLQGYVAGLSSGQAVSAGDQIAYNGDTGNARGIPHLHFEVMPGGGGNVNPYPYVRRACG